MASHLGELSVLAPLLDLGRCLASGDVDVELVDLRREVLSMVKNHVEVVLFLVDCELLPEQRSSGAPAYPWPVLRDWYQRRREDFGLPLLVDVLVEKAGNSLPWDSGDYPPPSVQQALEVYLLRGLAPWAADALCLYFLLDVASFLKEEHSQVEKKLGRFPLAVGMSADLQSFVEAIWKLDHGFYKDGVESLLEATRLAESPVSALLSTIWPTVLRHLMAAEEYALAMRYMGRRNFSIETVDHVELHLDVWLANDRVVDALELVRDHEKLCGMDHLLRRIVALEHTMGDQVAKSRLELMLRLPLSRSEEDALSSFFHDLGQTTWLCHLIVHFVQGGRVEAAVPLADRLRDVFRGFKGHQFADSEAYQQAEAVLELVQAFLRVRPLSKTSYHRAAPCPTVSAGAPLQGPIPTKVVHKGTTPSLASRTMAQVGKETAGADKHPPPRGRQEVVFPRFVPATISTSGPSTPVSALHLTKRLSLQSGLEADALSLLHTPPVKPWSPPAMVKGSSLGGARTSTPASILKPRVSLARPIAIHAETPPTPPALPTEPCPTPDAATRRLRFAMSDSSASDNGLDLEETPIDSSAPEQQSDAIRSREESVEQTVTSDESANCSFLTAAGSASDAESGTELEDESPRQVSAFHPQTPEQGAPTRPSHNIGDNTRTPSPPPHVFPEGTPLAEEVVKEDIEEGTELAEEEGCANGSPAPVGRPEPSSIGLSVEEADGSEWDPAVAETFEPEESGELQWRDEPGDCTAPRTLQISSFKVGVSIEPTAVADSEPTADIICVGVYPEGTEASLDGSCSIPMPEERDEEEDIVLILSDDESEQAHADVASTEESCEDSDEEDKHLEQESDRQVPRLDSDATGTTLEDKRSLDASSVATEEKLSSASQPETHDQAAQTGQSLVGASFGTDQGESERHCDRGPGSKNDAEGVKGGSPTSRTSAEEAHVPSDASAWTGRALQPEERSGNIPELGAHTDVHSAAEMPTEDSSSSASSAMSDPLLRRVFPQQATSEHPSPVVSSYLLRRSVREEQEHPNVTVRTRRSSGPTTPARKPIQASPKSARSTRRSGSVDPSSMTSVRKLRTPSPEKEQSTAFSIARTDSALGRTQTRGARRSSESSTRKDRTPSPQKVPGTPKGKGASRASSKNEGATARGRVSPARTRRGESSSPKGRGTLRALETPSPLPRLARLSVSPLEIDSEGSTVAETTRRVAQTPSPSKLRRGQTSPRKAKTPSPAKGPRSPKRKQRRSSTPSLAKEPPSPNNKRVSLSVLKDNEPAAAEPNSPEPTRLPKPPVRRSTRLTPRKQAPEDSAGSLEEMQVRLQSARKSAGGSSRKLPVILEDDVVVDDVAGQPSTKRLSSPHKSLPRIATVEVPMTRLRSRQLSGDADMEGAVAGTAKRKIERDAELATPAAKLHKTDALAKKDAQAAGPSSGPLFSPPLTRRRSAQRSTADGATPLEPATSRNSAAQRDAASASSTLSTSGRSRASPSVQAARKRVKKLVWKKRSLRVPLLPRSKQSSAKGGSAKP
uniref:Putative nuclear pore complex assembly n=1 Tax=Ixodes scapularis TaxID=6945 RepID=A0A4D5RZL2_IXOSC